jgi:hypothetical protein
MMQNSGPAGSSARVLSHGRTCSHPPLVHPDLAASTALAAAYQDRAAPRVEVVLGERERFVDAQTGAPEHDDHRAQPEPVTIVGGVAHHANDLVDSGQVRRVQHALVARWAAGVVAGHRRRRATAAGRVQQ